MSYFIGDNPLKGILHDSYYFPSADDISYIMNRIPLSRVMDYFHNLVREAIDLRIIIPRIMIFDGQFVRTNCNNNKNSKTTKYNDSDAGYYRHSGKKLGVGFVHWTLYAYCGSWKRALPIHFETFPGNMNDKPASRKTFTAFNNLKIGEWKMVMGDTGTYCKKSLEFYQDRGIFPLLRAPKHLKTHPTRELKKGFWFNSDYFPPGWTEQDILLMYAQRPLVEAGQSANPTFYNQKRLNTRGLNMAHLHRTLTYILDLMRAITAYKLGRTDLLTKLSAFSTGREFKTNSMWIKLARDSGFCQLQEIALNPRQKAFWDKRRKWEAELRKKRKNGKF
ncbi:hypothetical protein NEF87_005081 [Candidatus Lokiarchaeum ossiferum]|nr:hypothetical protein NEF87_000891 [Candidatus Lokiarchaeum sp. B-35]UYP45223.1 hypothetical protein NEF87_001508 [Candidatus Lokiarchaeum sp. B-35]UYP48796.1 hypothetical protein NEF87_005081 [Candidatus Lokiarchaeum sp. B-35]